MAVPDFDIILSNRAASVTCHKTKRCNISIIWYRHPTKITFGVLLSHRAVIIMITKCTGWDRMALNLHESTQKWLLFWGLTRWIEMKPTPPQCGLPPTFQQKIRDLVGADRLADLCAICFWREFWCHHQINCSSFLINLITSFPSLAIICQHFLNNHSCDMCVDLNFHLSFLFNLLFLLIRY